MYILFFRYLLVLLVYFLKKIIVFFSMITYAKYNQFEIKYKGFFVLVF